MKRLISLILCMALLSSAFMGCALSPPVVFDHPPAPVYESKIEEAIAKSCEGEFEYVINKSDNGSLTNVDRCFRNVTDIVKATYICTKQFSGAYMHEFRIKENVYGEATAQNIYVREYSVESTDLYTTYDIDYSPGVDYMLFLNREKADQYTSFDRYEFSHQPADLVAPLDENGNMDIDNSTVYDGALLREFLLDVELKNSPDGKSFLAAVLRKDQGFSKPAEPSFIDSDDIKEILECSQYVFNVEVYGPKEKYSYYACTNDCILFEVLKGDYEGLKYATDEIQIKFPEYDIEVGERYIVAVRDIEDSRDNNFEITGRHSIYPISEIDNIKAILNEIE